MLWLLMKLGFSSTILEPNNNPCIEGVFHPHKQRKHGWANPNSRPQWFFFYIFKGWSTSIGHLKARQWTRCTIKWFWGTFTNEWEDDKKFARMSNGFFNMINTSAHNFLSEKMFLSKHNDGTSILFANMYYFAL